MAARVAASEPVTEPADVLTVDETARLFRVSRMTVYRMVRRGELDHVRVGRTVRVSRAHVKKILGTLWPDQ